MTFLLSVVVARVRPTSARSNVIVFTVTIASASGRTTILSSAIR